MVLKYILFFLLLIIVIVLIKKYIVAYKKYSEELEVLFQFFEQRQDYDALKKIGGINYFGVREKVHVPSRYIRKYLVSRRDLEKEEDVTKFLCEMRKFDKAFIGYLMTSLILVDVFFEVCQFL